MAWKNGSSTDGFARHPSIGPLPWVYVRRELAKAWNCKPWEVDEAPLEEVHIELAIRRLEDEVKGSG